MTTSRRALHGSSACIACIAALAAGLVAQDPGPDQRQGRRLTYEQSGQRIEWVGDVPAARIAWDGAHVEVLAGKSRRWFDPRTREFVAAQPRPAEDRSVGRADAADTADTADPATPAVVRIHDGDLWLVREPGGRGAGPRGRGRGPGGGRGWTPGEGDVQLTTDGAGSGPKVEPHVNRDGSWVSFVRGGDFVLLAVAADGAAAHEWVVTSGGAADQFHGVLDWVYQEEIYGRGDFQGHWWSPAGDMVAFLSLDEAPVREFTVVNHVPEGFLDEERAVETEITNYPKAGDPNPLASLSVVHPQSRKVVPVDLSAYPEDVLVVRVEWTPQQDRLLVTLQDRIQTWAELCAVDPATGELTRWIREESDTWVNRPASPRWLADGSFLWLSERTGYQHVYRYERGGELKNAVTSGEWQVRSIHAVDEATGDLWFEGTRDGATGRHYYRTNLANPQLVHLTPGVGTHRIELSEDRSFLVDTWSAMDRPPAVQVVDGRTGAVIQELGQAGKGQASEYAFAERQRLTIAARDGYELDASLMLPVDLTAGRRYPVYLPTYSGPDAPSVRDAWSHSTYQQFLCQQGFIVLQVNVRSASGRGQKHTGTCYRQLGTVELRDLEDAVDHVCAEFQGDPARVAIEGWSYGGFMAAYALTHSRKFALGLAGAGVHDWRLYDTIYTERYMRTPQENASGYDRTSVIKAAKDLHGHLVLLHGSMDDNVHMQNTMQLAWELQKAGKQDFEMMIYPRSRHGLAREVGQHRRDFTWSRLQRLLAE